MLVSVNGPASND